MKEKSSYSTAIIGGADGPTSIFIAGKSNGAANGKRPFHLQELKRRFRKWNYNRKRKKVIASISANPHTIEEVIAYLEEKYHAKELEPTSRSYQFQKGAMKSGLVQQYAPELLGEMPQLAPEDVQDESKVKAFMEKVTKMQKMAAEMPDEVFYVDYACYKIPKEDAEITIEMEKSSGYITASWSGKGKRKNNKSNKIVQDIFLYYGVTKEDIEKKTERYNILVSILCS